MPATNGSATPSVAATATAASIALPPWRRTSSPAEVASTSSEATAPPVPTATGCFVIKTALAVAAGLVAAQLSTIAAAADSATKPLRVDLIDFLPGAGREGGGTVRTCPTQGHLNIRPRSSRTASAGCRGTGRASRSGVRSWAAGGSRGIAPGSGPGQSRCRAGGVDDVRMAERARSRGTEADVVAVAASVERRRHPAHLRANPGRDELAPSGRLDRLDDGQVRQRVDDPVAVDAARVHPGEDLFERW